MNDLWETDADNGAALYPAPITAPFKYGICERRSRLLAEFAEPAGKRNEEGHNEPAPDFDPPQGK